MGMGVGVGSEEGALQRNRKGHHVAPTQEMTEGWEGMHLERQGVSNAPATFELGTPD